MNNNQLSGPSWSCLALDRHSLAILNSLPIGVVIYAVDGSLLYVNDNFLSIFGLKREEIQSLSFNVFDNPNIPEEIKNAMRNRTSLHARFPFVLTKEGRSKTHHADCKGQPMLDDDGEVESYIITIADVTDLVLREENLRENTTVIQTKRKLQEKILDSIPLAIHIKDVEDNFKYVFCNEESVKLFGSCYDKTTYDVMDKVDAERIQKTDFEVFTTGMPYFGQEKFVLNDRTVCDTIVRKSIIEDDGKRLLLNIRWDQSLQNELKRRAKLLALTMETMNAFTWFYEPDKEEVDFGDGFDKVGDSKVVNSLETYLVCVHPDDRELFANSLRCTVNQTSEIWKVEYRLDLKNTGVYEWWETRGRFEAITINDVVHRYMFGMTICIDKHKEAEMTLLRHKEKLDVLIRQNELVLNNTNSGLAYITKDFIVQWENLSVCAKSLSHEAYKKGELCYKSAHNRTSPCENCVMKRAIVSHQTEQIKFDLDSNHIMEIFAMPVFADDGSVDGVVIRMDDITERESMIGELVEAKKLAEESDRLKSAFLANMSHEIRTPLNAIVGFSELLMSCEKEEQADYIQIIKTNNELLLKLISDILDLSKIEAGSVEVVYENFDLAEYFNDMALSMKRRVKNPKIKFVSVNPYVHCFVRLDCNRVAQIITNYATNAIKYTPEGTIEMGYEQREGGIYIYVKDTGIGIADDKKEKVFYRFEKLDEFAQGTGLGLSICKAIAESMGGDVGFESNLNVGSTFWAFIPCDVNVEYDPSYVQKLPAVTVAKVENRDVNRIKTILVVEDIQSNYLLVSAILNSSCRLVHVANGLQAIEAVHGGGIDLVLMDMKMPNMDGLTATAEIRKFNTELPIVALTAHAFESDRIAALAAGCNEYLVKPIDREQLIETLKLISIFE